MIGKTSIRDLLKVPIDRLDAEVILAHVLKKERAWIKVHDTHTVAPKNRKRFHALVTRRAQREPVAYLTGTKEFYGRPFAVNPHTLIPRPETELLVERALAANGNVYWDVGTGSGAIAVTIACAHPHAKILATDVNARALTMAKKNARIHGARITTLKSDLLQPAAERWLKTHAATHLVIAANLPYLPMRDKKTLTKDVTAYEPSSALFSGTNGLTLIHRFLSQLKRHVAGWGFTQVTILLEYDPPQTAALKALIKKQFPQADITIYRDLAKRERLAELRLHDVRTK